MTFLLLKTKKTLIIFPLIVLQLWFSVAFATELPLSLLSLEKYSQEIDRWINPNDANFTLPLVEKAYQEKRAKEFYKRYFSTQENSLSPWHKEKVTSLFSNAIKNEVASNKNKSEQNIEKNEKTPTSLPQNKVTIHSSQQNNIDHFRNIENDPKLIPYGENFRPLDVTWFKKVSDNMDLKQFENDFRFYPNKRAILVQNTEARALPVREPLFYHFSQAGEGYPFDNLQVTALWAGTPIYILGQTKDKAWSLVLTPDVTAWINTECLAKVSEEFITQYQNAANKNLAAITETQTPIIDVENKRSLFLAFVGSIFPVVEQGKTTIKILVPVKDYQGNAKIRYSEVSKDNISMMPLLATRQHFSKIIKSMAGRPYGWGGSYFFNDCSAELKSIFTPFGIWLPRHSTSQTEAGKMVDMSNSSVQERLDYLRKQGHPLMTIVYVGKHVFLYVGNDKGIMTYQNVWALKSQDKNRRAVIGKAVFLPLLETYPEDKGVKSHAVLETFKVIFLDAEPEK